MFASVFVLARDAATLKRKRGRRRRRRRKLVRLFVRSLSFDDENKQNTDEEKQATKIWRPKKKTRGCQFKKIFSSETERYVSLFLCSYLAFGRRFLSLYDTCESGERRRENQILSVFVFRKKVLTTTSRSADAHTSEKRIQILRESAFNSCIQATNRTHAELL
jgi:hypothetical protein